MKALLVFVALFVSVAYSQPGSTGPCSAIALPGPYLTPLSVFGSNVGAQPNSTCGYSYPSGIVWFSISPGSSSNVTVRTCSDNTNFDTFIYVLSGTCRNSTCVGTNDDGCSSGHSSFTWISSGDIYLVGVGGYSSGAGKFQLTVSENVLKNGSVCQSAVSIPGPYAPPVMIYGNNSQSIGANVCSLNSGNYIDWYTIYPAENDQISLSTCFPGTTFDTTISVFTGNCQYLNCTLYSDDNCTTSGLSYASGLSFVATSTMYYVAVAGYSSNRGNYQFQISANSYNCSQQAEPVKTSDGNIQIFGTSVGSPVLPSGMPSCGSTSSFSPAVWYLVTGSGTATVSSCSSYTDFDTVINVYQGACSNLRCITSNDDSNCVAYSHASTVSFTVSPNTNYWVVLTGYAGASGNYILSFTFT